MLQTYPPASLYASCSNFIEKLTPEPHLQILHTHVRVAHVSFLLVVPIVQVKLAISELKDRTGSSLAAIVKWITVRACALRRCKIYGMCIDWHSNVHWKMCHCLTIIVALFLSCFVVVLVSAQANYYVPEDKCKKHAVVALKQAVAKKAVIKVKASYKLSAAAVKALSLRKRKEKQVAAPRVRTTKRRFPVSHSLLLFEQSRLASVFFNINHHNMSTSRTSAHVKQFPSCPNFCPNVLGAGRPSGYRS